MILRGASLIMLGSMLLTGCQSTTSSEHTVKNGVYEYYDDNGKLSTILEYHQGHLMKDITYMDGKKRLERYFYPDSSKMSKQVLYAAQKPHLLRMEESFDIEGNIIERMRFFPNKFLPSGLQYQPDAGHIYYSMSNVDGSKNIQRIDLPHAHRVKDHVMTGFGTPGTSGPAYTYHDDYRSFIELVLYKPTESVMIKIGYASTEKDTCTVSDKQIDLPATVNGVAVSLMGRCSEGEGQSYYELYPGTKASYDEILNSLLFKRDKYVQFKLMEKTIPFDRENFSNYFRAADWEVIN